MSASRIPGKGTPHISPSGVTPGEPATTAVVSTPASQVVSRPEPALPPAGSSLKGKTSPLSGLISDGLAKLAKAEGWEAQQNALNVLVGAMTGRGLGALESSAPKADPMTERDFAKLFAAKVPPERRAEAKEDAKQIATLAVVAMGPHGLEGKKPSEQERQLRGDLTEIRSALAAVLAKPDAARNERLASLSEDLAWVGGVLGRSEATAKAQPRVDAVVGMLKIVLKYADAPA